MKALIPLIVVACCLTTAPADAQPLTAAEIDAAIRAGQDGTHKRLIVTCEAVIGFREMFRSEKAGLNPTGSFEITLSLTTGRIALLSAAARRFYKPFAPGEIPDDLKTLDVVLDAEPRGPQKSTTTPNTFSVTSSIEQIVIKAWPKRDRVVLPRELETEAVEWPDIAGSTVRSQRARARFPVGEIQELPPGDIEIAVVTPAGERTCVVSSGDRRRAFGR